MLLKKYTHKVVLTLLLLGFISLSAWADSISLDEACAVAQRFVTSGQQTRRLPGRAAQTGERLVQVKVADVHSCYFFNRVTDSGEPQGFIIVAADDVIPHQVLAFGDSSIDPQNMPPALQDWLAGVEEETSRARAAGLRPKRLEDAAGNVVVAPLITTRWAQSEPYNSLCPTKDGERCVTGCVATAMAQVMNYYQWPEKGKGSITYFDEYGCGKEVSVDFSKSTYDWAHMTDAYYTWTGTDQEKTAIATLMRDCGASIQMHYTPTGSGTTTGMVANALKTYFSYSPAVTALYRNNFNDKDWEDMIRSELDQNRPLVYSGGNVELGGHAFVCDGYDDAGYVHFNFGWAGISDGWYLSTSNIGFSHNQCMIYGCMPERNGGGEEETEEQDTFSWTLTEDGVLTILGKGKMPADYTSATAPWLQPEDDSSTALARARSKVTKVIVGKGITNVASNLFEGYGRLKKAVLPEGLVTLDYYCFGNSPLEEINLPSTLTTIGSYAFCRTNLQSVIIPAATFTIGAGVFSNCQKIGDFEVEPDNKAFRSIEGALYNRAGTSLIAMPASRDWFALPEGVNTLTAYSIGGSKLTSFVVPDGVTLEAHVFRDSKYLESLRLPSELTAIPYGLCMYCNSLKDCPIPDGVTEIGDYAFEQTAFTSVTLPAALTVVNRFAFDGCTKLTRIECLAPIAPTLSGNFIFRQLPEEGVLAVPKGSDYSTWLTMLPPGWTVSEEFENGISVMEDDAPCEMYDLLGRRLQQKPTKGIYILNGRKVYCR